MTQIDKLCNKEEFDRALATLCVRDWELVIGAVKKLNSFPFVKQLEYQKCAGVYTMLVSLSEPNSEHEKQVYGVEYELLREMEDDFDFWIVFGDPHVENSADNQTCQR